tara:strand:- start:15423 stop:15851 length:429 start_codon:yes stop_codon:yes gene_type:complete
MSHLFNSRHLSTLLAASLFACVASPGAGNAADEMIRENAERTVYKIEENKAFQAELSGWRILIFGPVEDHQTEPALIRFAGEPKEVRHPILREKMMVFMGQDGEHAQIEFTIWGPATIVVEKERPKVASDVASAGKAESPLG